MYYSINQIILKRKPLDWSAVQIQKARTRRKGTEVIRRLFIIEIITEKRFLLLSSSGRNLQNHCQFFSDISWYPYCSSSQILTFFLKHSKFHHSLLPDLYTHWGVHILLVNLPIKSKSCLVSPLPHLLSQLFPPPRRKIKTQICQLLLSLVLFSSGNWDCELKILALSRFGDICLPLFLRNLILCLE